MFLWWENHRRGSSEAGVRHSSWEAFLHLRQLRGKTLKNIFIHYVYRHTYADIFLVLNKADGFHYRQPWVIGVQEQIESLTKRLEEAEQLLNLMPSLKNQIETLEVSDIFLNYFLYFSLCLSLHFALLLFILITCNVTFSLLFPCIGTC